MKSIEFISIRLSFKKTQKQMAELLGISLRSIQSFEQGWRKIPTNTERQILYLVFMKDTKVGTLRPCWEIENCPLDKRKKCPAWGFNTGYLCWFINGTICQGKAHRNWNEKMGFCSKCPVFKPVSLLLEHTFLEYYNKKDTRSATKTLRHKEQI